MIMNIFSKPLKSRWLFKNYFHRTHSFFTRLDIFISCTIISTFFIIIFNFFYLFLIKQYLCNSRMILNRNSKSICNRLIHCIPINFITKSLISFCNRCSSKTNKSSLRKRFFQNLCIWLRNHRFHICVCIFAKLNFLRMFKLSSMRFI